MKKVFLLLFILCCVLCSILTAQPTSGLVAFWRLNGNFTDSTANAINGTAVGSPTGTPNNNSIANWAMNFNNPTSTTTQYATHPVNTNLDFNTSENFTLDMAVYMNTFVHNGGFYDNNLNYNGYGVWYWSSGFLQVNFNFRNTNVGTTNGAVTANTWYKITAVRSGSTISLYVNGVLNNSVTLGSAIPAYNYPARFGTMSYDNQSPAEYNPLHGKMDNLRIYNRALSQTEITQLYTFWVTPPTPVKLSAFTAAYNGSSTQLNWQTETEQNASYFSIERSMDGTQFTEVGKVTAKGNSSNVQKYSHIDLPPPASALYYRLKMVDADGTYSYSKVVNINTQKAGIQLLVYPNPVITTLQVQAVAKEKQQAEVEIFNSLGSRVQVRQLQLQPGTNNTPVDVEALPPGTYSLRLSTGGEIWVRQFVKK